METGKFHSHDFTTDERPTARTADGTVIDAVFGTPRFIGYWTGVFSFLDRRFLPATNRILKYLLRNPILR